MDTTSTLCQRNETKPRFIDGETAIDQVGYLLSSVIKRIRDKERTTEATQREPTPSRV